MAYQYVREPLTTEEADRLCQACETTQEKLIANRARLSHEVTPHILRHYSDLRIMPSSA